MVILDQGGLLLLLLCAFSFFRRILYRRVAFSSPINLIVLSRQYTQPSMEIMQRGRPTDRFHPRKISIPRIIIITRSRWWEWKEEARAKERGGASRNEVDVLAVQFSYSVRLERKKERSRLEEQSDRRTEGILYLLFFPSDRGRRFKDRSGILKGGSLKLIAYVHVSSKECAWICSWWTISGDTLGSDQLQLPRLVIEAATRLVNDSPPILLLSFYFSVPDIKLLSRQ